jgi:hypothetical protein
MSKIELPVFVSAKMPIGNMVCVTDPDSDVELLALSFHLEEKWIEEYATVACSPDDPLCIKFSKVPIGRKFFVNEKGEKAILKINKSFDVKDAFSNEIIARVRV